MEKVKVLIADDDEKMRDLISRVILKRSDVEIAAICQDGAEALEEYDKKRPEIVLLDVDMPGIDGVQCAREIFEKDPMTAIIFITAHEEYMDEAFEVYAFDYVVKPFKIERLYQTLDRYFQKEASKNLQQQATEEDFGKLMRLPVKSRDGIRFVDMEDIVLIQREEGSTVIYTNTEKIVTSEGLGDIEARLDSKFLMRSHKSYIINLQKVKTVTPYGRWSYIARFKNFDKDALVNTEKYNQIEKMFGI